MNDEKGEIKGINKKMTTQEVIDTFDEVNEYFRQDKANIKLQFHWEEDLKHLVESYYHLRTVGETANMYSIVLFVAKLLFKERSKH
jgi:hypothetical protein